MMTFSKNIFILIIEDNADDFILIEDYLKERIINPTIVQAKTFSECEIILNQETKFDIIFLNLFLPDATGKFLVEEIVKIAGNSPIIALTGQQDKDFSVNTLSLGVSDYLLKDELNASLLYKSIIYNIERKRINNELKESEKKYRDFFRLSPVPMWVIDPETLLFLNVNNAALLKYGYILEEFLLMKLSDIKPNDELASLEDILKKNRNENGLTGIITTHLKKNGERIQVEIQSSVIEFNNKKAWLILATDITEKLKAQKALTVSEHYFKTLVQQSTDLICIVDINGVYKYVSPSSKSMLGLDASELINKNGFDDIHEEDRERVFSQFNLLRKKKHVQIAPFRFKNNANNTWIWLETNAINMMDDPAINGIVSNSRNITLNVNYNLKLKQTVERYETLAKATSDAIWDHDFELGKTYIAGNGYKNLFGYDISNEFTEDDFWESKLHPEQKQNVIQNFADSINDTATTQFELEYRFLKANGIYAYVHDRFFIIRENNRSIRMLGAKQDITKQKEEEYRLKLLESVITNTSDAVMITEANPIDEPGPKIVFVNKAFLKMSGYSSSELIGKTPRILQGPKTNRVELDKIRTALEVQNSCEAEVINYHKNGEEYWVEMAIAPVTNHTGKVSHLIAIERDITNRKNLEQEKEKLINELIENNKDLRQFSYITSHNLRGPIANLLGLSGLVENYKVKDKTLKEILNGIRKATVMFDETIKDLTKVLNIKDRTSIPQEEILLETIIEKTIVQNQILISEIGAKIDFNFTKAPIIKFNKAYCESIFYNLLSNSIKYRSPNRPLTIFIETEIIKGDFIMRFSDNGLGIDTTLYKDRLFKLHQRFHDHAEGKGLGLFLIKSQMEAQGGNIDIESKVGVGTTFIFKFKR